MKRVSLTILFILSALAVQPQDVRTTGTKVADLLARMPVYNSNELATQMKAMTSMGPEGREIICRMVVPPGSGDDTRARFAIESYSRYIPTANDASVLGSWESTCIKFVRESTGNDVKRFFLSQLNYFGGPASVELASGLINDGELCEPAVAVMSSAGKELSEEILASKVKDSSLPCIASVLNTLGRWKSVIAVDDYARWLSSEDPDIRRALFHAMAMSGSGKFIKPLGDAAKSAGYGWDREGSTLSYLLLAGNLGEAGDMKSMEKICRKVMSEGPANYYINALEIIAACSDATSLMFKALSSGDKAIRMSALAMINRDEESSLTTRLRTLYQKSAPENQAEIIYALGLRGDNDAAATISEALSNPDPGVRSEAAYAMARLEGGAGATDLVDYLGNFNTESDRKAAVGSLMMISDHQVRKLLDSSLDRVNDNARIGILAVLAASGDNSYFDSAMRYVSSENNALRISAVASLVNLAGPANQEALLTLLTKEGDPVIITYLQSAMANAAKKVDDPAGRASVILAALPGVKDRSRFIPVLAQVGGEKALNAVLEEFRNGSMESREASFKALANWNGYEASYALFEICKGGSKTFSDPAFDAYVKQVGNAPVPPEQKLLLLRKIMPFASTDEKRRELIGKLAGIRTFQSLLYASSFMNEPALEQAAVRAAMSIALPPSGSSSGMYGKIVSEILTSCMKRISGEESDYDRERIRKYLESMPGDAGFVSMFNGRDLAGWQGLVENPVSRSRMGRNELLQKQAEANKRMIDNWTVKDGAIWFSGKGDNLCSVKQYGDFEMLVDWRITKDGDSGIYLRGSPQVQIWDTSRTDVGAQVGSGGLYNNQKNRSTPLKVADNPVGDWNSFRIVMNGERVSVWLNGELVVDDVVMENYWDRSIPIFPEGPIELQAHGNELAFRDIYVREIKAGEYNLTPEEKASGFVSIFNGRDLDNWIGNKEAYVAKDGMIVVSPDEGSGGNLYTSAEYGDFNFRFEFKLTPGANNGLGIRAPLEGDAAYVGMELQILDNTADIYADLQPYQYHGSVYGVIPAKRGYLNPVGEWNSEEVIVRGTRVTVILNGNVIVDGDIAEARDNGTMDHRDHPGLKNEKGHIGFLGHGSEVMFRNIRILELK